VLDLALINKAAAISGQISPLSISFDDSVSSDHTALTLNWYPLESIAIAPPPALLGFTVDDLLQKSWVAAFTPLQPQPITDISSLQHASDALHADIDCHGLPPTYLILSFLFCT